MTRPLASVITRNNIFEVACKAKALCPENLRMAFQKTGIFLLDQSAINTEYLLPSTVFNCETAIVEQEQNVVDENRRDDNERQQVGQGDTSNIEVMPQYLT